MFKRRSTLLGDPGKTPPPGCETCGDTITGACDFGCSTVTVTTWWYCFTGVGCSWLLSGTKTVTLPLTLLTDEVAQWGNGDSVVQYHFECGWSAAIACQDAARDCDDECDPDRSNFPVSFGFADYNFCGEPGCSCGGPATNATLLDKSVPDLGSSLAIAEFFGCDTSQPGCHGGRKIIDITVNLECKNVSAACTGAMGYAAWCTVQP